MLIKEKSPHGGDVYTNSVKLDFSANINPSGMPDAVRQALINAAKSCEAYPDPYCTALWRKLAEHEHVPIDHILCGNGAAELIYDYAYALPENKPALIASPTFSEYGRALSAAGVAAEHYVMKESDGFRLTEDFLRTDLTRYSTVFVCSPNNPTGITVDAAIIRAILESGARLLFDLCFLDLTDTPDKYGIPELLQAYPNLTVLRAFTKSYAMAGVRLGYAMSTDGGFLAKMSEKTQCWNVSTLAQEAGIAALECGDWLAQSVMKISTERRSLAEKLTKLGIKVYPGEANYLLLYSETDIAEKLMARGIMLRNCSNYVGLGKGYVRIAVRTREENELLLTELNEVLK